jgi:hypothetical protein
MQWNFLFFSQYALAGFQEIKDTKYRLANT